MWANPIAYKSPVKALRTVILSFAMQGILLCLLVTVAAAMAGMRMSPKAASFQEAAKDCRSKNASLPAIFTIKQQQRIKEHMVENNIPRTWTGLNRLNGHEDENDPSKWVWRWDGYSKDLKPTEYYWDVNQPDNKFGDEYCVAARILKSNEKSLNNWNDCSCPSEYFYFCDEETQ